MKTHLPNITVNLGFLVSNEDHNGLSVHQRVRAILGPLTTNANPESAGHLKIEGLSESANKASEGANTPSGHAHAAEAHKKAYEAIDAHLKGFKPRESGVKGVSAESGMEAGNAAHGLYIAMKNHHQEQFERHLNSLPGPRQRMQLAKSGKAPMVKGAEEEYDLMGKPLDLGHGDRAASYQDWQHEPIERTRGYAKVVQRKTRAQERQTKQRPPIYKSHEPQ